MNIFNIKDLHDIPIEIREEFVGDVFAERIIELFKIANRSLHIDEVAVGYYRKYNEIKTKRQIMTKLYNMSKQPYSKIKSCSMKGVYKLEVNNG